MLGIPSLWLVLTLLSFSERVSKDTPQELPSAQALKNEHRRRLDDAEEGVKPPQKVPNEEVIREPPPVQPVKEVTPPRPPPQVESINSQKESQELPTNKHEVSLVGNRGIQPVARLIFPYGPTAHSYSNPIT